MLSCKEVSQLVSESLDRKLSLRQRLLVRIHLMMCGLCRRFRKQMFFLREKTKLFASQIPDWDNQANDYSLSHEAKQRMKEAMIQRD